MSNNSDDNSTTDPVTEELTAYLDGELDADGRAAVERRLAKDETYRRRLHSLERAWELLDVLPRSESDASFAQSTVEMIALAAEDEVEQSKSQNKRRRWVRWIAGSVAVILAALVGYRIVDRAVSRPNEQLVRDLPVIENVELYRHVESVEFLRELDAQGLFAEDVEEVEGVPNET